MGRSIATPTKFFSVDFYDLKSLSLKFSNDIFITFEMPRVAYNRPVRKINILLLFRPSVIRGLMARLAVQFSRQIINGSISFYLHGS